MITDKDYNQIADKVYEVDPLKQLTDSSVKVLQKGDTVAKKFVIIEPPVNAENGMQAMAVA